MTQKKAVQPPTYRARLRFRLAKKIDIEADEYCFMVSGRTVVLSAPTSDCAIRDAE